jgi:tRNA G37 N-methylase Trm5
MSDENKTAFKVDYDKIMNSATTTKKRVVKIFYNDAYAK